MQKSFREKIHEYRSVYLLPITFYTKKEGLVLRNQVIIYPSFVEYLKFIYHVFKEILVRGAILLASKIKKSHE